jgi:hypothetical protein
VPPLFACSGCGSQWAPGAGWTPIDADGTVPDAVRAAVRAAGAASRAVTTDRPGDEADSADT